MKNNTICDCGDTSCPNKGGELMKYRNADELLDEFKVMSAEFIKGRINAQVFDDWFYNALYEFRDYSDEN